MRRVLTFSSVAFLLAAALGCYHTAGVCDCDHGGCCGGPAVTPHPVLKAEPVKAMPKAEDTGK